MPLTKYSLGTHLDDGLLRLLYLRKVWRDVQVVDTLTLSLPSDSEAEGAFSQEVQKFLLRNGVRPLDAVTFGVPRADILFRHFATPPVLVCLTMWSIALTLLWPELKPLF